MINEKRLLKEFLKLLKIKSLSLYEKEIMLYLFKQFRALGLNPYFDGAAKKVKGEIGNLFCLVPGEKGFPMLLLNAHVDTVGPWEPFIPKHKGNFIFGSGKGILGADDKAGVAMILEVLRTIKEKKIEHGDILVVLTIAEEIGLTGAKAISPKMLKADYGIALDGGRSSEIVYKAPSQNNFMAEVFGKAAHAGIHPEHGINAIYVASRAIAAIKNLGRVDHETTCNVGIKGGGQATNIIPEHAWVKGEVRSHKKRKLHNQMEHIKACFAKAARESKAKMKFTVHSVYDAFEIHPESPFFELAVIAIEKEGILPTFRITGGGSDANVFNSQGIPTLILGTGMERVHTKQERLNVREFVNGTKVLLRIVMESKKLNA
ncbi:MAG: M20/M25/M40 family metallo-hydrolase [Candidatus Saganbacteria bacterium]|nr:M20/M25/M40 family metallo-hydrolase [Candidatus Saganbacteria bacterium]